MAPPFRKLLGIHWLLFGLTLLLLAVGVYSIYAAVFFRDGEEAGLVHFWQQQLKMSVFGLVPYFAISLIDYKWLRWACIPIYVMGLVAVGMLSTSFAVDVHGQKIALQLVGINFQPAQLAITGTIFLLAVTLGEAHVFFPWMRHYLIRFLVSCVVVGIPFLLMVKQGDLGSAMVMVPLTLGMMIVGNVPFRCIIATGLMAMVVIPPVYFFVLQDYQQSRISVTADLLMGKEVDIKNEGYALVNILTAVGSAGWEGKGLDPRLLLPPQKNMTQLGLVPKLTAHNDFIYAVQCETFGFRGASLIAGGFLCLLLLSLTVAFFARDALGRLLATGIIALIFGHVFEHIGMNIGLLPITGIPLPLMSYGGTFLLVIMTLLGLMQSVWIHRNAMHEEQDGRRARRAV